MVNDLALADLVIRSYAEPENFGLFRVRCETDPETGTHLIGFSGTIDVVDWMANFRLWMIDSTIVPGGRLHAGFERLWLSVLPSIRQMIARQRKASPGSAWLIAGHSLGGVLATLAARFIREHYPEPAHLVTFGTPRFGDLPAMARIAARGCRNPRHYRLRYDPVPGVPAWRPWRPYADPVGGVVYLPRPSNVARMIDWKSIPIIRRHDLQRYRDELALDVV